MGLSLALREWSAVVDALGHGQQAFMVRGYPPKHSAFLLYPTFSYYTSTRTRPEAFVEKFQAAYLDMARRSAEQTYERAQNLLVDFRYYAELDEILTIDDPRTWERLKPYFIWSVEHVQHYANPAFLWMLRVYKLQRPVTIGRSSGGGPPTFYKHDEEISTDGASPVISDNKFEEIRSTILSLQQLQPRK